MPPIASLTPDFEQSALPVVIVLAAGRGERFSASGGTMHKLDALLGGQPVRAHVLAAVRASGLPFHVVEADASRPGMGDSISAGVRAAPDARGWLILPADLPLVLPETLRTIAFAPPMAVTVPRYRGQRGHPVRFAAECGEELSKLEGKQGAAQCLRGYAAINCVAVVDVDDAGTVMDIDTLGDLQRAEVLWQARQV